jgi:pimeloyl-ACP methyl ester carboxylesterase
LVEDLIGEPDPLRLTPVLLPSPAPAHADRPDAPALAVRPDFTDLLPRIDVPTLVLVGLEDSLSPLAVSREMAAAIPGATLAVVPSAPRAAGFSAAAIAEWAAGFDAAARRSARGRAAREETPSGARRG